MNFLEGLPQPNGKIIILIVATDFQTVHTFVQYNILSQQVKRPGYFRSDFQTSWQA